MPTPHVLRQGTVGHTRSEVTEVTAAGAVYLQGNDTVVLNNAANIAVTVATTPKPGDLLEVICLNTNNGTTLTLPSGVTWDGTNRIATFDADGEYLIVRAISTTRWFVIHNTSSVAFSNP